MSIHRSSRDFRCMSLVAHHDLWSVSGQNTIRRPKLKHAVFLRDLITSYLWRIVKKNAWCTSCWHLMVSISVHRPLIGLWPEIWYFKFSGRGNHGNFGSYAFARMHCFECAPFQNDFHGGRLMWVCLPLAVKASLWKKYIADNDSSIIAFSLNPTLWIVWSSNCIYFAIIGIKDELRYFHEWGIFPIH